MADKQQNPPVRETGTEGHQRTDQGFELPVPKHKDWLAALRKVASVTKR